MKVRKLTESGLKEFENYIHALQAGSSQNAPLYLLEDASHSEIIDEEIELDQRQFSTRYEMGVYLVGVLQNKNIQPLLGDVGFWSWFGLYWFDQLCPKAADGSRKPKMAYNYILSRAFNHRPRHAIFITWQLVDKYAESSKFLLCKEMHIRGELMEQMMARQKYFSSNGVIELASKLYFDVETQEFKKGSASRAGAGCVTRLVSWLQQLELNYDLFSMSNDDLLGLLPAEFDRFNS